MEAGRTCGDVHQCVDSALVLWLRLMPKVMPKNDFQSLLFVSQSKLFMINFLRINILFANSNLGYIEKFMNSVVNWYANSLTSSQILCL